MRRAAGAFAAAGAALFAASLALAGPDAHAAFLGAVRDLDGVAFGELFMDRTMLYSSGVWDREGMSLEESQVAKVDSMLERVGVGEGMRVLRALDEVDGWVKVIADADSGWIVHHADETDVVELKRGLSVVGENDVDDPRDERVKLAQRLLTLQTLDSPVKFLAVASKVFARAPAAPGRPSMVMRNRDYGTVSSSLISLGTKPRDAIYQYASGAPDRNKFEDYSPLLRDILSRGLRETRTKTPAGG